MLVQLLIQDIVLIDRLDIEFDDHLSVLSGETGAGKSILLDSLSLALGARGDGGLVRQGASSGEVRAVFSLKSDHTIFSYLDENEIISRNRQVEENGYCELILRRVQSADGRTRASINEVPISVAQLRDVGKFLVEIHGQHDERALVDGDMHRKLLDAYGGFGTEVDLVANAWKSLAHVKKDRARLEASLQEAAREAEYLRSSVSELELLSPDIGEETELADQRQKMMSAQGIASDLAEAEQILSGNSSPAPILASLARKLERKTQLVPGLLEGVIEHLDGALTHIYTAQNELNTAINASEYDQQSLDDAEERLFALRGAARKYNVPVENLPELATQLANELNDLDHGEEKLKALTLQCEALEIEYHRLASDLSDKRKLVGAQLVEKVMAELPSLKLEQAEFLIDHESGAHLASREGVDRLEFWVRTNPGTKSGPMFKVASGGELSRFLLALKVVLAENGSAPTLVFDEIDTGVGGAVADSIGRRLERLASHVQVLSVTHAPQVAARARHHFLISKSARDAGSNQVTTDIKTISGIARRDEVARMLAGALLTDEAKAAADSLLSSR